MLTKNAQFKIAVCHTKVAMFLIIFLITINGYGNRDTINYPKDLPLFTVEGFIGLPSLVNIGLSLSAHKFLFLSASTGTNIYSDYSKIAIGPQIKNGALRIGVGYQWEHQTDLTSGSHNEPNQLYKGSGLDLSFSGLVGPPLSLLKFAYQVGIGNDSGAKLSQFSPYLMVGIGFAFYNKSD